MLSEHELLTLQLILEYFYMGTINISTMNYAYDHVDGLEFDSDYVIRHLETDITQVLEKVLQDYKNHPARFER